MVAIYLLIFSLLTLASKPTYSLSLANNPNFSPPVSLFGDAEIVNGGSSAVAQLTRPIASSSGLFIFRKPFKFLQSNPTKPPTSFSVDFSFSISPQSGDGIALVIVPTDFPHKFPGKTSFGIPREAKFLGIEFDTSMDANVGDENGNHVGVDVGSFVSARVCNVSSLNLVLNSGITLRSWVDYDARAKKLEVRLSEMGNPRPVDPLIAFPIDLAEMWKGEEVFFGISSSSGNSVQTSTVYSWKFRYWSVPKWMHSQPADPRWFSDKGHDKREDHKKFRCPLFLVSGLIVGIGCGAVVALVVLILWAIFVNGYSVIPVEYSLKPTAFGYEKVSVVVENSSGVVKK